MSFFHTNVSQQGHGIEYEDESQTSVLSLNQEKIRTVSEVIVYKSHPPTYLTLFPETNTSDTYNKFTTIKHIILHPVHLFKHSNLKKEKKIEEPPISYYELYHLDKEEDKRLLHHVETVFNGTFHIKLLLLLPPLTLSIICLQTVISSNNLLFSFLLSGIWSGIFNMLSIGLTVLTGN